MEREDLHRTAAMALLILIFLILAWSCDKAYGQVDPGEMDLPVDPGRWLTIEPPPPPRVPLEQTPAPDPPPEPVPPQFYGEEIPATADGLVYLVDLSGSMNIGHRLQSAKGEVISSIMALDPWFSFNVYGFAWNGALRLVRCFESMRPATPSNKAAAVPWVATMAAGGGTPTGPAVVATIHDSGCDTLLLLSDGIPNSPFVGTANQRNALHRQLINSGAGDVVIHTFGIDCTGPLSSFLQHVASDHQGSFVSVH